MQIRDYDRIIDSLAIRFIRAQTMEIINPVNVAEIYDVENTILVVNSGQISYTDGDKTTVMYPGDILLIPEGKTVSINYGTAEGAITLSSDNFANNHAQYLKPIDAPITNPKTPNYSFLTFEAKVFDSVNFFASLDLPPFLIKDNKRVSAIMSTILDEKSSPEREGNERVIRINTEYLIIEAIRHVLDNELFVEKLATNSNYFKDIRLINIFKYIKNNLGGDLSNKVLASVANVSEDYVGQYFKILTGINPQDYIEYQRMEKAVKLLRASRKSIRDIGREVGYKDAAYFCRRFKMMFGISAGKMRRRKILMEDV